MLSIRIHQHGGPEVLSVDEVPRPALSGADQILVAMKAAALNHLDLWVRNGLPGVSLPLVLGSDVADVVEEIGEAVEGFAKGDEVVIQPGLSPGGDRRRAPLSGGQPASRQGSADISG